MLAAPGLSPAISNSLCSPWEDAPTAWPHHSSSPWASKCSQLFLHQAVGCSSLNLNALHSFKSFIFSLKPGKLYCLCPGGVSEIAWPLCESPELREEDAYPFAPINHSPWSQAELSLPLGFRDGG